MDDLEDVRARVTDLEVTRFTGGTLNAQEAKELLQKRIRRQSATAPFGNRAIELKETGRNIGYCGLNNLPQAGQGRIEVSYGLTRSFWGKGFATEAASAMIRFGFELANLEEIVAAVHPGNVASLRVVSKLGLRFEKKIHWPKQGEVNLYTLSRKEYFLR
jgi:RimJ/RimL family protein N-acetyltransferase